eukprot:14032498-Ditylum_brightwellii.AAC.1
MDAENVKWHVQRIFLLVEKVGLKPIMQLMHFLYNALRISNGVCKENKLENVEDVDTNEDVLQNKYICQYDKHIVISKS